MHGCKGMERGMLRKQRGFSLLELLMTAGVVTTLATVGQYAYGGYLETVKVSRAIADIGEIHLTIQKHLLLNDEVHPTNLAEIGFGDKLDPWGNPYQYLLLEGETSDSAARKDQNQRPINRNYDLYSMGSDGRSEPLLASPVGMDDVVLARDGIYLGRADGI